MMCYYLNVHFQGQRVKESLHCVRINMVLYPSVFVITIESIQFKCLKLVFIAQYHE